MPTITTILYITAQLLLYLLPANELQVVEVILQDKAVLSSPFITLGLELPLV